MFVPIKQHLRKPRFKFYSLIKETNPVGTSACIDDKALTCDDANALASSLLFSLQNFLSHLETNANRCMVLPTKHMKQPSTL